MSGIVAVLRRDGGPVEHDVARRLTDLLAFRGPGGLHVRAEGSVGLGHALLECRDEGPPDRQLCSLDGEVWITADVRLDAREDLLRTLEERGRARGRTDAELVLEAYRLWGVDCVDHLRGDFAFAIWDGRERRLFCARDHFGVKPFYYALTRDFLIVSNTLQCVRGCEGVSARLNEEAIGDFLVFGSNLTLDTTIFSDVQRLPPATVLDWHDGDLRFRRYWNLPAGQSARYRRPEDIVARFREVLGQALRDRMPTRQVSVLMSGGLDSTTVAAAAREVLAARGGTFDLRAYTIVFDRLIPDQERYYSTLAANHLDIPIQHLSADNYQPFDESDDRNSPEPTTHSLNAAALDLYANAASHSRIALTGEGCDAVFFPNPLYLPQLLGKGRWGRWLFEVAGYLLSRGKLPPLGLRAWWRRRRGQESVFPPLPDWLAPDFVKRTGLEERRQAFNRPPEDELATHPASHRLLKSPLWTNLFEARDAGSTGVPVEFQYPFFDMRMIDFVYSLPAFPWCIDKDLVRNSLRGRLPERVRARRKTVLAGDPLKELLNRDGWRGRDRLPDSSPLSEYVSLEKVRGSLRNYATPGGQPFCPCVHALCLDRWLSSLTSLNPCRFLSKEPSHAAV